MSDNQDIQFGEVEHAAPVARLRPDCNRQFAVVACGTPDPDDLLIFVDLDAMRELEQHARSDPRVELGGVLLGGQFQDDAERPYVVVQDSLRARHYESSKGSFKFTHDTWADITRRRDQFPAELQMVGWYHTHPDWGVFLSGMDMFICDHFFNRPLDIALVIDPCQGQRGWFQWTSDPDQRVRPTAGFYLTASRHRRGELEKYAAQLEGKLAMTHDVHSSTGPSPASFPITVTNVPDPRGVWLAVGVLGMLTVQLLALLLIAWRLLPVPVDIGAHRVPRAEPGARPSGVAEPGASEPSGQMQRVEAQLELLDRVIEALDGDLPTNLASLLEDQRRQVERIESDVRAYRALESGLQEENLALVRKVDEAARLEANLRGQVRSLDQALADAKLRQRELRARIASLESDRKLATAVAAPAEADRGTTPLGSVPWWIWAGGGTLIAIVLVAVAAFVQGRYRAKAGSWYEAGAAVADETGGKGPE